MLSDLSCLAAGVELHVQRDLVIAASAGMKFLARVSNPFDQIRFHKTVDILIFTADRELSALHICEDLPQSADHKIRLLRSDDPLCAQHTRMRDAALYILSV